MEPQIDEAGMEDDTCSRVWLVKPDPSVRPMFFFLLWDWLLDLGLDLTSLL
jgi:hypothetical protein